MEQLGTHPWGRRLMGSMLMDVPMHIHHTAGHMLTHLSELTGIWRLPLCLSVCRHAFVCMFISEAFFFGASVQVVRIQFRVSCIQHVVGSVMGADFNHLNHSHHSTLGEH
mmetsp:Transcript_16448/g.26417  ORF Transcript_16448/g.26417 Transcript_16448/m.26417 type:complete len:110 (+) Transcript_16448:904-1233(+)